MAVVTSPPILSQTVPPNETTSSSNAEEKAPHLPLVPSRKIEYTATEGTWLSLDVSPDGKSIVFDLVGHIYTVPISGGDARSITSGLSFDSTPRFSPDGTKIVYVSDRSGADNVWVSNINGSDARALTADENTTFTSPSWTADGHTYSGLSKEAKLL